MSMSEPGSPYFSPTQFKSTEPFSGARLTTAGLWRVFPTADEFLDHRFAGRNIREFYLDNLDLWLPRLASGVPIHAVALTGEEG